MRESEIHFSRWIFDRKEKNYLNIFLFSFVIHVLIFSLLYCVKPKQEIVADQNSTSIKVNFSNLRSNQKQPFEQKPKSIIKPHRTQKAPILTDFNSKIAAKNNMPINNLSSFLPSSNDNYINNLRQQSQVQNNPIEGDVGDIPIEGPSLAPTNQPRVLKRYAEKDMSLFQFTQEFRERFSAVWNAEDRIVPPTSPLRPGDIVYYKIFINSNGSMQKFENLSRASHPQKDYSDIDKLFTQVVVQVFPMSVPSKFAHKNITLTEVIAIQVVDKNLPVNFSF